MHVPQDSIWQEILKTFWISGWTKQGLRLWGYQLLCASQLTRIMRQWKYQHESWPIMKWNIWHESRGNTNHALPKNWPDCQRDDDEHFVVLSLMDTVKTDVLCFCFAGSGAWIQRHFPCFRSYPCQFCRASILLPPSRKLQFLELF